MTFKELFVNQSKTLIINTDLALVLGDLNEAIVLNQLNYWLEINERAEKNFIDGKYWVYNTYSDWKTNNFPYWSEKTIQRTFSRLESKGVVIAANYNKEPFDKTKWYTIDTELLQKLVDDFNRGENDNIQRLDKMSSSSGQNDRTIPENTTENTSTVKTQSNDCVKVKTCSSKDSHDTNKARTREEMLEKERDMVREFCKICCVTIGNATIRDAVARGFGHYMERYRAYFGKVHPILTNETLRKVCITLSEIRDDEFMRFDDISVYTPDENGVTGLREIIDEHFRRGHKEYSDYSIAHFANSKYLTTIARGVVGY